MTHYLDGLVDNLRVVRVSKDKRDRWLRAIEDWKTVQEEIRRAWVWSQWSVDVVTDRDSLVLIEPPRNLANEERFDYLEFLRHHGLEVVQLDKAGVMCRKVHNGSGK